MSDQQARTQALIPDQSFIVQAPAGSGKTELLTQRILSLLANNAHSPESLLAITFTKKAAHEMRMRVLKALQAGRDPHQPEAAHQQLTWNLARRVLEQDKKQAWNLLDNPQRLQIMTIDSLCASLVRQMPVLSEMGGMPSITERAFHLYQQAAKTTLMDLLTAQDESVQTLLLHLDNRQENAVDLIARMLAKREQWLPVLIACQPDDNLRQLLERNLEIVVNELMENFKSNLDMFALESLKPMISFALKLEIDDFNEIDLKTWNQIYKLLFTTSGTVRKTVDKRSGFPADKEFKEIKAQMIAWLQTFSENEDLVQSWQVIPKLPEPQYSDSQWDVLLSLIHILPHACAQLQIHLQTHSEIDFSGIAQAARTALGHQDDPSALTLKLDYQLQHILIDEFQDTSLQQYALIEQLISGWMPGDGRTLFLVGDPMQSIYRFRQAEVGLFLRVQEEGIANLPITPLHLTANFRSDPSIIEWINHHAKGCFSPTQDINLGAIAYSPSEAAREAKSNAGVNVHATGNLIPDIEKLLKEDSIESIAILVRARGHLTDIVEGLKSARIPYQAVELEGLSAQALVQDLLSLTRAMVHLADSIAWLSVLRAPFCGLSLEDITLIRETDLEACVWDNLNQVDPSALSIEGQKILARILPVFEWALSERMCGRLTLAVQATWRALGGEACLQHESDLNLAESYFSTLASHERGGTLPDLYRLIDQLNQAYVKSSVHQARVQVMTLHKSKGLEFDAVLLPELQRTTRSHDRELLLWEQFPTQSGQVLLIAPIHEKQGDNDPLYEFLKFTQAEKEAHERGRTLYVGMTRAKKQLHLFARLKQNEKGEIVDPSNHSLLGLIWPTLKDDFCMVFDPVEAEPELSQSRPSTWMRLSPDWKSSVELVRTIPEEDNTVPLEEHSYSAHVHRQVGILIHRILYKIAVQGLEHWGVEEVERFTPHLEAQLRELGVHRDVKVQVDTVKGSLVQVLNDSRGRWILHPHAQHEAEAVYGSSIIDRTFIDENGHRWIIDYKTSSGYADEQLEQYRRQLARYAQIFADRGEKNIRCALYYPLFGGWTEL